MKGLPLPLFTRLAVHGPEWARKTRERSKPGRRGSGILRCAMTYSRAAWLFLRLLGVVYFAAFWSMAVQVHGLIGSDGISPAATLMSAAREWADSHRLSLVERLLALPT